MVNYCIFLQELRVRTRPKREFGSRKRPPLIRKGQKGDYVELLIDSHFGEEECWLREEWGGVGQKERARRRRHHPLLEARLLLDSRRTRTNSKREKKERIIM